MSSALYNRYLDTMKRFLIKGKNVYEDNIEKVQIEIKRVKSFKIKEVEMFTSELIIEILALGALALAVTQAIKNG